MQCCGAAPYFLAAPVTAVDYEKFYNKKSLF